MSGTVYRFGRYASGVQPDYGYVSANAQTAYIADDIPQGIIVYRLGAWLGQGGGSTTYARLGLGSVSGSAPATLLAYTGEFSVGNYYVDPAGGQQYFANITPYVTAGNTNYALVAANRSGLLTFGMIQAASISGDYESFWSKSGIGGNIPTNPIGGSAANNGHMAIWAEGELNVAPNTPSNITVSNSLTPVIEATFDDVNEVLNNGVAWDYMASVRIRVLQGATVKWDYTYDASSTEQNNDRSSRTYAGSALLYNTSYTVEVYHKDRLGLWSSAGTKTFTITPPNTKPNKPTGLTPSGANAGTDLTPTLTSNFSDPDEVLSTGQTWDYLNRYQIQVTRVSDGALMWNPAVFTPTTAERDGDYTTRDYAGTALAYNTTYRYAIRHEDRSGAWSDWATSDFSITSLSTVDQPSTPSGFTTSNPPANIQAVYRHQSGLSSNAVEARLLSSGGSVIATSATIAKTVAANATITITWAEAGFGTLTPGGDYQVQVRARDTNNQWSPSWSPARAFSMNDGPNVPTNLSPSGGAASPNRPLLTAKASDPDPEQGYPTVYAEILNAGGTVLFTRTMTHTGSGNYSYQTTSTDLAAYATYQWRAYSYDGTLYSGDATSAAAATRSANQSFVYAAVPSVTVTGPASPVATTTPRITWTTSGQVKYRVQMYDAATGVLAYDTGTITSASAFHDISPTSYWQNGEKWNNGETMDVVVSITDAAPLTGSSASYPVTLTYPAIASIDVVVTRYTLPETNGTNAVRVEWERSAYSALDFARYEVRRVELIGDTDIERAGTARVMDRITDPSITEYFDADVTSKQRYRWSVRQVIRQGNDELASDDVSVVSSVEWTGLILHAPVDPVRYSVGFRYGVIGDDWEPEVELDQPSRIDTPIGQGGRVAHFGRGITLDPSMDVGLLDDEYTTAESQREKLIELFMLQGGEVDDRPHDLCWREGRGGPTGRVYGKLERPSIRHARRGQYAASLQMVNLSHTVGVAE